MFVPLATLLKPRARLGRGAAPGWAKRAVCASVAMGWALAVLTWFAPAPLRAQTPSQPSSSASAVVGVGATGPAGGVADKAAVSLVTLQRSVEPHMGIAIDYALRLQLPKAVVELMQRGVPVYFTTQATVLRPRWYWRDERVTRVTRVTRVVWQPLTATWRVGQGGLNQSFATLADAMAAVTRGTGWLIAEPHRVEPDERYLVQFVWQLDTSQLPAPMQLGVGSVGSSANDVKLEAAFGVIP